MNSLKVSVIGAGSWGTATANVLAEAGQDVCVWGRDKATVESINKDRSNPKYLKGVRLSSALKASTDLETCLTRADWIVSAIPTQQIRSVFKPHQKLMDGKSVVNTAKGLELNTHMRVSEIFAELSPSSSYFILSGPSFAKEVANRLPTAVTVAGLDEQGAEKIQQMFSTAYFRAYRTTDVVGVELCGALKNVIAIAAGMVSGLKLGYNAQAAIINRGMAEVARLGRHLGADPMTCLGLAGMGDLVLTCTGPLSRNRSLGVLLAEGKRLEEAQRELGGVAEGLYTADSINAFAEKSKVEMPISTQIYNILYKGSTPQRALEELMKRELKQEWD